MQRHKNMICEICGKENENKHQDYCVDLGCTGRMIPPIEKTKPVAGVPCSDGLSCDVCGGKMVYIRGRHPGMDNRLVCPICMAETLDDIKARLRTNYGQAEQRAR